MTEPLAQFEVEVLRFLDAHASRRGPAGRSSMLDGRSDDERLRAAKAWQRARFDAGLGWITGPCEYGGRELTERHERLYRALEGQYDVPGASLLGAGMTIIAAAIVSHGSQACKDKYLPRIFGGDVFVCQLYSEPSSGSDLAGVQTRARRDGDQWVITGQKVWSSGAHFSDFGQCVCRTNVDVPKHRGITIFMVDMRAPGVEVRPLRDATGEIHFNEVFLNDVRVSDNEDRLGPVDDGWRVLNTSLMNERVFVGDMNEGGQQAFTPEALARVLRDLGRLDDPVIRDGLADLFVRYRVADAVTRQVKERLERGELPGPEMSFRKLAFSENQQRLVNFAADALGPHAIADCGNAEAFAWSMGLLKGRSMRIAGGTDDIQRNIIGERVLGLARDPAIDNSLPFSRIMRSVRRSGDRPA